MIRRISSLFLCLSLLFCLPQTALAQTETDTPSTVLASIAEAAECDSVQKWIDTSLSESLREGSGEWFVFSLCGLSGYDLSCCAQAIRTYLASSPTLPLVSEQKYALALSMLGYDSDPFLARVLSKSVTDEGIMPLIWGIILGTAVNNQENGMNAHLSDLIALQREDGGFSLAPNRASDPDVTAMALIALSAHKDEASEAIDRALACLTSMQKASGGFSSWGVENAESCAQVIIALCALGIDPTDNEILSASPLTALLSYRTEGGFAHTAQVQTGEMATAQALLALVCVKRMEQERDFVFFAELEEPSPDAAQDETAVTPQTEQDTEPIEDTQNASSPRYYLIGAVLLIALILLVILLITRKATPTALIALVALTAILILLIATVKVQTPKEYYGETAQYGENSFEVTLSILIEDSGEYLLNPKSIRVNEGDSVYDALVYACKAEKIPMDVSKPIYVKGIGGVFEKSGGTYSGWVYTVNNRRLMVGCDQTKLNEGDEIVWKFVSTADGLE